MSNKFFGKQKEETGTVNRISHSQFKKYRSCPAKWAWEYVEGLSPPDESIHLVFGVAIHEVLQLYLRKMYEETVRKADDLDLKTKFTSLLKKEYDKRKESFEEKHSDRKFPVTKKEMVQFAEDGKAIIEHFKRNRSEHFNKQKTSLVGIEEKIEQKVQKGVVWVGYLDVVIRDRKSGKYKIIDLKTSTDGWDKWKRREKKRTDQLVAYKSFYAEQLGIDPNQIEIEYLILKRKVDDYEPRFQQFTPASGKEERERVQSKIEEFLEECFTDEGEYRKKEHEKNEGKWNCCFCPFATQFAEEGFGVCDQSGKRYMDYPNSMKPYIPNKLCGPQPEQK